MDKLKEVLFSRTLMYHNKMKSATLSDISAYSAAYLAVNQVATEFWFYSKIIQHELRMGGILE